MIRSRRGLVIGTIAVAVLGLTTAIVWSNQSRFGSPRTIYIESSYGFDVSDKRQLAGYSEDVFLGRVVEAVGSEDSHTQYSVEVLEPIKGRLEGTVTVSQLGYVDGVETHEAEDQPLLVPGQQYVLVTNPDIDREGWHTLIAGPASAATTNETNRGEVVSEYRRAVRNQFYPPGQPPKEKE
jgi:hypothetical protein